MNFKVCGKEVEVPNVKKITVSYLKRLWEAMKVFTVDAVLFIVVIGVVIWAWFDREIELWGFAYLLIVYISGTMLRLNDLRKKLIDAQKELMNAQSGDKSAS